MYYLRLSSDMLLTLTKLTNSSDQLLILMCSMNGEAYLTQQIESFIGQTDTAWSLTVSDDGSTDMTMSILDKYQAKLGIDRVSISHGPRRGFAANFLTLACKSGGAEYYAYSDQDDIWSPEKNALALKWLSGVRPGTPALYCARTEVVDAAAHHLGFSRIFTRTPSFANALAQNIAGGNTMVFNDAARQLLERAGSEIDVIAHDWWTYLVVSGCGGEVFYDPTPVLKYRQHGSNLIGANHTFLAPFTSVQRLLEGSFREWTSRNIAALNSIEQYLTPKNRAVLREFEAARNSGLFSRVRGIVKSGIYRQTRMGNIGLAVATLFRRI